MEEGREEGNEGGKERWCCERETERACSCAAASLRTEMEASALHIGLISCRLMSYELMSFGTGAMHSGAEPPVGCRLAAWFSAVRRGADAAKRRL